MKTDFKIGDYVFLSKDTARAWGHGEKFVQRYGNRVYTITRVVSAETMRSIYAYCVWMVYQISCFQPTNSTK